MLNPKVDMVFKKLFGSEENKDILISFINSVVSEKDRVVDVKLMNPYNDKEFSKDKLSILDVKAKDESTGKWYNIEMQIADQDYFDKRAMYYWARLYTKQLSSGINYDVLEKTICINILDFKCIEGEEDYHNIYKLLNVKSHKELLGHLEIHFIELKKHHKELKTLLDKWITFLNEGNYFGELSPELKEIESIQKALDVLENMSLSSKERMRYEDRLKYLRDEEMRIKTAERKGLEIGLVRGLEKGIEQGIEQGIEKGIEQGKEKGKEEALVETIINGIENNISMETLSLLTGLSIEEIERIIERNLATN